MINNYDNYNSIMEENENVKNGLDSILQGLNCSILTNYLNFFYAGICALEESPSIYHGFMTLAFYQFLITFFVFVSICCSFSYKKVSVDIANKIQNDDDDDEDESWMNMWDRKSVV